MWHGRRISEYSAIPCVFGLNPYIIHGFSAPMTACAITSAAADGRIAGGPCPRPRQRRRTPFDGKPARPSERAEPERSMGAAIPPHGPCRSSGWRHAARPLRATPCPPARSRACRWGRPGPSGEPDTRLSETMTRSGPFVPPRTAPLFPGRHHAGHQAKTCSSSCLSLALPLRSWGLRQVGAVQGAKSSAAR